MSEVTATNLIDPEPVRLAEAEAATSRCRYWAIGLAFLFFLLYLPALPSLSRWRGDERFYTDAAVGMIKSGNYLAPTYEDGSLRFRKPILTYWAVVAGYKIFGFNYFGSRFFFLAAGSIGIWLSFELCLLLTRKPEESLVAAAIMASNLTVQNTSIRSTPDMLVCVFLLISLLGFVGLIFHGPRTKWYLLAYFGAALAIATKGLSGLLPIGYAFLYCALARRPSALRLRQLLHPWIVPAAVLLAGTWYLWAFTQHGDAAAGDFLGDQVGNRLSGNKLYILENAAVYLWEFFRQMLPWSLLAGLVAAADWRSAIASLREQRKELWFAAGWILLFYVVFVPANIQRTRYFMPVYPFLALMFSKVILKHATEVAKPGLVERSLKVFLGAGLVTMLGLAALGWMIDPDLSIAGLVLGVTAIAIWWGWKHLSMSEALTVVAGWIILAFSLNLLLIVPVFISSPAPELVRFCETNALVHASSVIPMAGVDRGYQSQVRALSGGTLMPLAVLPEQRDEALNKHGFLICSDKLLKDWNPPGIRLEKCASGSAEWKARDYLALFKAGGQQKVRSARNAEYFLVKRAPF